MDRYEHFKIIDNDTYYTIENVKANDFDNYHTHLNKRSNKKSKRNIKPKNDRNICEMLISLICNKTIPKSDYLKESAKRLSRDEKYIQEIEIKKEKDKQKPKFIRVNRGKIF